MTRVFPWTAVIGQERLKLALLLCAIDPGIGGVLVRGPRGVAKTTLARAFAELLPGRFVELPLGATEERVTGTLDLGKVLENGEVVFSPGLLARAHEGVLYVDEVNLLADGLVDLLLDAAATGSNVVERDGVSHAHAARFVLVGTMNPEEGELRAQFVDRFGLSVAADALISPHERAQIVMRRLSFERDPELFWAGFEGAQQELIERCARARQHALSLDFQGPGLDRVTKLCHAAGVEGVRADLAMLRAARAHAAWHERHAILAEDVDAVAELALAHRRRNPTEPSGAPPSAAGAGRSQTPPSGAGPAGPMRGKTSEATGDSVSGASAAPEREGSRSAGDRGAGNRGVGDRGVGERGALPPVPVRAIEPPQLPQAWIGNEKQSATPGVSSGARRRRRESTRRGPGSIDWFGTLARQPRPTHADLRRRSRAFRPEKRWVIAVDCSASMLQSGALSIAKGVAQALAQKARAERARLTLISFSGHGVRTQTNLEVTGSVDDAIAALGAGGGTPLRHALLAALRICERSASAERQVDQRLVLLTDGRTREDVSDLGSRGAHLDVVVLDCEQGAARLGRARGLAAALGGSYVHVASLLSESKGDARARSGPGSRQVEP